MNSISQRALNRATLARQMLLERTDASALDVVERLVGMQAQAPFPPYFGLWSRISGFRPDDLARLIEARAVVRIVTMRSTVHLMSAADALTMRALLQPALERMFRTSTFGKELAGVNAEGLVEAGRALVDEAPRTGGQLAASLSDRWPTLSAITIQNTLRTYLALVQVPPRGIWGRSGHPTFTTVESWLGQPMSSTATLDDLVLRYLAGFGPASVADIQAWSGLTRLGEVVERLAPGLVKFTRDTGPVLYDLPDAPRPDEGTPAPVRLIAEFDNLTLAHADRTRVLSDEHRKRAFTNNGIIPGTILVDGVVAGVWKLKQARVDLVAYRSFSAAERDAAVAEAGALLAFATPTETPDVTFTAA